MAEVPAKPPGFLQRLLGGIKFNVSINRDPVTPGHCGIQFKTTVQRTIKIHDSATGETKEYHSLEEVPEKYREKLRSAFGESTTTPKQPGC